VIFPIPNPVTVVSFKVITYEPSALITSALERSLSLVPLPTIKLPALFTLFGSIL
jgi:hypothetical protein